MSGSFGLLVVDDEPDHAALVADGLTAADDRVTVTTATGAQAALDAFEPAAHDCIVSGYDLPRTDGLELCRTVRERAPGVPFFLYSRDWSDAAADEAVAAGVTDYVAMPDGSAEYALLANRVRNAVEAARARTDQPPSAPDRASEGIVDARGDTDPRRTRARLNRLAEVVGSGLFVVTPDYEDVLFVNDAAEDIYNTAAAAFQSDPDAWLDHVHPDDRQALRRSVQRQRDGTAEWPVAQTFRIQHPDDGLRWVLTQLHPITDSDGAVVEIAGVTTDITEQKRREKALDEANTVLETVVGNLPMGILVEDSNRDVLAVNERLGDVLGIPLDPSTLRGRDCAAAAETIKDQFAEPNRFLEVIDERIADREPVRDERIELADGRLLERDYLPYALPDGEANLWLYRDVTGRQRRLDRLERQEFLFDRVQEIATIGIWEYDPASDELSWSDGVRDIHGVEAGYEPTLEDGYEFYRPADRDEIERAVERALQRGDRYDLELQIVRADGEIRDVRARGEVQTDADGTVTKLRGVFQDVTDEKRRERELRQLSERLDLALEGGQLGVWDWNVRTDEVQFNERWAEMLGHSLDEIDPHLRTWEDRAHPEDLPESEAALEAHFAGETEYYQCDHRMQTKSGDWIWVRDVGKVVERDANGDPVRAVGIHQDITTDKRRERELRELLERSRELIAADSVAEAADIAVGIADETFSLPLSGVHLVRDGERLDPVVVTDALRERLGFSPSYRRTGGDRQVDALVWDVFESRETRVIDDLPGAYPDLAPETPSQSAIIHPLGPHGVFTTSTDETNGFDESDTYLVELLGALLTTTIDRIETETQVESQRDNLHLLNEILRHDIRNDLQVILGRLDMLADSVDADHADLVETATERTLSAVELTQTARDMSDVMLQDEMELEPVSLRETLRQQLDSRTGTTGDATVAVDGTIPDVSVRANEMLESVLRNLLSNAIYHNDSETPTVTVSVHEAADSVVVSVADDGPGIPPEQRDNIFGKGQKGLDSEGTGIGLYLVSTLVEQFGGEIWVEDAEPRGSVFNVRLQTAE